MSKLFLNFIKNSFYQKLMATEKINIKFIIQINLNHFCKPFKFMNCISFYLFVKLLKGFEEFIVRQIREINTTRIQ